ncbi:MAG: DUF1207 domain-containing protein [Candidatus Marinimicrobia bacterium]|nr:DUF1207 domain-containing protein [Candidatus Neomarinimicrobiota bacterium]MCF7850409.1 DUF1207 domain-containing protein [Candidatus Neomarinimicrobiota bacterium]MCF7904542.1 DUF1207 domain-containing protein [Candidatus Neomarinimicrobiota bacterium]
MNISRLNLLIIFSLTIFPSAGYPAGHSPLEWLPSGSYYKTTIFDPTAPQTSASILAYQVQGSLKERVYSPINIGTQKMVARHDIDEHQGIELGLEFGLHSQFSIVDSGETLMGGLQNTDYRIGAMIHYRTNRSVWRVLLFHQSSHLGDDYMLRNTFFSPNSKVLNYEQLSLTRMHSRAHSQYYYGFGYNVSPNTTRKRSAFQGGYQYRHPFNANPKLSYLLGLHVKADEQNDYRPNVKAGVGIELGSLSKNPFMIFMEYYHGNLPYSTLEYQIVQLYGLGVYFHL